MAPPVAPRVTAVVLAYNRARAVATVLDRLDELDEVDEVVVVDGGSDGTAAAVERRGGKARALRTDNLGIGGRNRGVRAARGEYLLMLDDDSYPLPGAVPALVRTLEAGPRVAVAGGLILNVDYERRPLPGQASGVGTFDWWLRAGHAGPVGPEGIRAFFFPEGGALIRRDAFLEAGGFFEPYFFGNAELDLATRLAARGWEVRYQPAAVFEHLREPGQLGQSAAALRHRVRNLIWYFWMHFPAGLAARRIPAYLAFDLIDCVARGQPGAWAVGVREAWTERERVRGRRRPLPRSVLRRAERNRGRRHLAWLAHQVVRRLARRGPRAPAGA